MWDRDSQRCIKYAIPGIIRLDPFVRRRRRKPPPPLMLLLLMLMLTLTLTLPVHQSTRRRRCPRRVARGPPPGLRAGGGERFGKRPRGGERFGKRPSVAVRLRRRIVPRAVSRLPAPSDSCVSRLPARRLATGVTVRVSPAARRGDGPRRWLATRDRARVSADPSRGGSFVRRDRRGGRPRKSGCARGRVPRRSLGRARARPRRAPSVGCV